MSEFESSEELIGGGIKISGLIWEEIRIDWKSLRREQQKMLSRSDIFVVNWVRKGSKMIFFRNWIGGIFKKKVYNVNVILID